MCLFLTYRLADCKLSFYSDTQPHIVYFNFQFVITYNDADNFTGCRWNTMWTTKQFTLYLHRKFDSSKANCTNRSKSNFVAGKIWRFLYFTIDRVVSGFPLPYVALVYLSNLLRVYVSTYLFSFYPSYLYWFPKFIWLSSITTSTDFLAIKH